MPYDYLWSEEEISKGNGLIIRALLKQIKKAYEDFLNNQNNNVEIKNNANMFILNKINYN